MAKLLAVAFVNVTVHRSPHFHCILPLLFERWNARLYNINHVHCTMYSNELIVNPDAYAALETTRPMNMFMCSRPQIALMLCAFTPTAMRLWNIQRERERETLQCTSVYPGTVKCMCYTLRVHVSRSIDFSSPHMPEVERSYQSPI